MIIGCEYIVIKKILSKKKERFRLDEVDNNEYSNICSFLYVKL